MTTQVIDLPDDAADALAAIAAAGGVFVVFKRSPICPVSFAAEREFDAFLRERPADAPTLGVARVDVIARRGLARGLTTALGIPHQSPQALVFRDGKLAWHESHGALVRAAIRSACDASGSEP